MAKIRIHAANMEPVWFQFDNLDSIEAFLSQCGYSRQEIQNFSYWATSPLLGTYEALPGAKVHKERGNAETMDFRTNEWIASPPEMEAFLADLRAVFCKHGLSLRPDEDKEFLVQPYSEENVSWLDGALKDYDVAGIRKQPQAAKPAQKWEYRSAYIDIGLPEGAWLDTPMSGYNGGMVTGAKVRCWQDCLEKVLCQFGDEGWELIAIQPGLDWGDCEDGFALFKRQVKG